MDIKPIETIYNGYRFRSRLEARWAVFFDAIHLAYEYEYEGYNFCYPGGEGYYLPDFYFPKYNIYAEVKGSDKMLKKDFWKIIGSIDYHSTPIAENGLILLGTIPNCEEIDYGNIPFFNYFKWDEGVASDVASFAYNRIVIGQEKVLSEAFYLGKQEYWDSCNIDENHLIEVKGINLSPKFTYSGKDLKLIGHNTLKEAYAKARQARFEHGECG